MRRRNRETAPETMTPAQIEAAEKLARETLKADHEAIERYAKFAVGESGHAQDRQAASAAEAGNGP